MPESFDKKLKGLWWRVEGRHVELCCKVWGVEGIFLTLFDSLDSSTLSRFENRSSGTFPGAFKNIFLHHANFPHVRLEKNHRESPLPLDDIIIDCNLEKKEYEKNSFVCVVQRWSIVRV